MSEGYTTQILLPIGIRQEYMFDGYFSEISPSPAELLKRAVFEQKESVCIVVGPAESGKTHLCASVVNHAHKLNLNAQYISFKELVSEIDDEAQTSYIESLVDTDILVLDDIDEIAGNAMLELALFNLYNHCVAESRQLVLSCRHALADVGIELADLVSRLQLALNVRLKLLSDDGKKALLSQLAGRRGMKMSPELAEYICFRSARNMNAYMGVLERLDHASLLEKRSLTVPFVKKVMGW